MILLKKLSQLPHWLISNNHNKRSRYLHRVISAFILSDFRESSSRKGVKEVEALGTQCFFVLFSCILPAIFTVQSHTWLSGVSL